MGGDGSLQAAIEHPEEEMTCSIDKGNHCVIPSIITLLLYAALLIASISCLSFGCFGGSVTGLQVIGGPNITPSSDEYTEAVKEFLNTYNDSRTDTVDCTDEKRAQEGEVCNFQSDWISNCRDGMVCVYITLSLKDNHIPEIFTAVEEGKDLPQSLIDRMEVATYDNENELPKRLWLNCECATLDEIHYAHWPGYPVYYFDQQHAPGYIKPFVLVSFQKPDAEAKLDCAIYAKDIDVGDSYYKTSIVVSTLLVRRGIQR